MSRRHFVRTGSGLVLLAPAAAQGCDASTAILVVSLAIRLGKLIYELREPVEGDVIIENRSELVQTVDLAMELWNQNTGTEDMYVLEIDIAPKSSIKHEITRFRPEQEGGYAIVAFALDEMMKSECFRVGANGSCSG